MEYFSSHMLLWLAFCLPTYLLLLLSENRKLPSAFVGVVGFVFVLSMLFLAFGCIHIGVDLILSPFFKR